MSPFFLIGARNGTVRAPHYVMPPSNRVRGYVVTVRDAKLRGHGPYPCTRPTTQDKSTDVNLDQPLQGRQVFAVALWRASDCAPHNRPKTQQFRHSITASGSALHLMHRLLSRHTADTP